MKKILVNGIVKWKGETRTVGELLFEMLEGIPANNTKDAVRQIALANDLEKVNDKKGEWFAFEDSDQAVIEGALDAAAKVNAPRIIEPLSRALDAAIAFKGEEPKEEKKTD